MSSENKDKVKIDAALSDSLLSAIGRYLPISDDKQCKLQCLVISYIDMKLVHKGQKLDTSETLSPPLGPSEGLGQTPAWGGNRLSYCPTLQDLIVL